ncbi:hypothetical protein [Cohnella yongneupensis]|uniref:HK97 gp10 family phage protein n=1 Tax=Cohnella yongneupensis TaxID=425006 RepID=A0ABW0QZU6_9BACL
MADEFEIDLREVFRGIEFMSNRIRSAAERGMKNAMDDLAEEADHLAPKLTGKLRSSRKVVVTVNSYSVTGEVTYAATSKSKRGWEFNYALRLHEYPGRFADPSTPGTGPKFLSRPLKAKRATYEQMIADEIRKELT